jgi:hypothetical protein
LELGFIFNGIIEGWCNSSGLFGVKPGNYYEVMWVVGALDMIPAVWLAVLYSVVVSGKVWPLFCAATVAYW